MSYILDALKRAESERERGSIPGIHSQQVLASSGSARASDAARPYLWPALGLSVVALGALALFWYAPFTVRLSAISTADLRPTPPAPSALPAPQITPITAVASIQRPVIEEPVPEPVAAPSRPSRKAAAEPGSSGAAERRMAAQRRATEEPPIPAVPKTPEGRIYALNELPSDIRQELPNLVIGGSSYSSNPALRMLMINGKMYQEREQPFPNVQLDQIRQGAAVLKYKGYRYRVTF
ncbi:MAG: general secretion pathway protein GspB [Pseudomonadota bacterium]